MASSDTQRKLTAILCADVVGYSRLMGENERATLRALTQFQQIFSDYLEKFRGRIVNAPGDSILAEFASVVDAVEGASEIQRELAERNAELLEDRRMLFRIGINHGDVMVRGEEIYGDAVNIAARLESLAEPGGICVSRAVFDQVKQKLKLHFEYMGEQQVKNIAEPVRAYQVRSKPGDAAKRVVQAKPKEISRGSAEIPSIAVLPFTNMGGDQEQEFFGDGLVEDILTSLSAVSSMTVIARNSTFIYKGKAVDVRQVASDLGVRYVVEGSVRRSGNRLRVTTQLIDSIDGSHLWAERYDRVIEEIFDIQDEITKEIVTALRVKLSDSEQSVLLSRGTNNVQAWGYCVQALDHFMKFNPVNHARARELAVQAAKLDPAYAMAWAILGFTDWFVSRAVFDEDAQASLARAVKSAEKTLALDATNSWSLGVNMVVHLSLENFDQSLAMGKRLISLYPGSADSRAWYGFVLLHCGRPHESIGVFNDAMRLNPRYPPWYQNLLARALDVSGKPEESLEVLDAILAQQPEFFTAVLARTGTLAREGRGKEAKEAMTDLRRINPNFRLAHLKSYFIMRDQEYVAAFTEALRKAGLPE